MAGFYFVTRSLRVCLIDSARTIDDFQTVNDNKYHYADAINKRFRLSITWLTLFQVYKINLLNTIYTIHRLEDYSSELASKIN